MGDTAPTTRPAFAWGVSTHAGKVRPANEDNFVAEPMVLGIADGMGGHQAGEVASELAVDILRERLGDGARNVDVVVAAVVEANASIFRAAHTNAAQRGMGTTLTAIALLRATDDDEHGGDAEQLVLVNVGDSRTYVRRSGALRRASIDHSYVQELVATGHITEAEARTHPRRNIVTRALGIEPTVRVDTWVLPLVRGDRYVLCSDGLVDEVPDDEIDAIVAGDDDPQAAADHLVDLANEHGGRDNVTVIVVDVLVGADPPPDGEDGPYIQPLGATLGDGSAGGSFDDVFAEDGADGADGADAAAGADAEVDGLGADGRTGTPLAGAGAAATAMALPAAAAAAGPRKRGTPGKPRRITLGMFLFLLALAAIVTLTVVLVAVAVSNNDDSPAPSTTVETTTTVAPTTTTPASSSSAPTTSAPTTSDPFAVSIPATIPAPG